MVPVAIVIAGRGAVGHNSAQAIDTITEGEASINTSQREGRGDRTEQFTAQIL